METDPQYDVYWKLLSDEQIASLASHELITIGSHAFWHNNLSNLTLSSAEKEIQNSLDYLRSITNTEIENIAFPDGSYNQQILDLCIRKGLNMNLGSHYLFVENASKTILQHRMGVYPPDNISEIYVKLKQYIKIHH